ncbi:putative anonymous antigen-1, partial [Cardiosporidium cionae]
MCDGTIVDCLLNAMLEHEAMEEVIKSGINCLNVIATAEDCTRHLRDLDKVASQAKNNPEAVYSTMAAIAGLSRVSHLQKFFIEKNAAGKILKMMGGWIEASPFQGQTKIIQNAVYTLKVLELNSFEKLHTIVCSLCDTACLPQMKRLMDLQEPDDNVLIYFTACIKELAAVDRITGEEEINACVENIMKIMKKYTDIRRSQINCLGALDFLARADSGDGVQALIKIGTIKSIIAYLIKTPMYLDAQLNGFTVMTSCAKIDPASIEIMKKNNALQALQVASRTHAKSKPLKNVVAPLIALLLPAEALEKAILEKLADCKEAMAGKNAQYLNETMSGLNELILTAEGSKIAAKCGTGPVMKDVQSWTMANMNLFLQTKDLEITPQDFYESTLSEIAQAIVNVAQTRSGLVHLIKSEAPEMMIDSFQKIGKIKGKFTEEWACNSLEALRLLLRHERACGEIAFSKGLLLSLRTRLDDFPDSSSILVSACGCLAAMCSTPGR